MTGFSLELKVSHFCVSSAEGLGQSLVDLAK
jgi:hypothetical protein